jgi:hypothetical protein
MPELTAGLATLPEPPGHSETAGRPAWARWQAGRTVRFTLPACLPSLRLLLVLDNLTGHKTPSLVLWLVEHGVMPLYTPLSGSWLTMAESIQRILVRRALDGQPPDSPATIIDWLEATARGWNADPHPRRVGRQAPAPTRAQPPTAPPDTRRLRRLRSSPIPSPPYHPRPMATFMPSDPLVARQA